MAKNYVYEGKQVPWTNDTGSDVSSGDRITVGDQNAVALEDIADGESGAIALEGVFTLDKVSGSAWEPGDKLAWDDSEGAFDLESNVTLDTDDVSGDVIAGGEADSDDTEGPVKLGVGVGTVS
ncbi:MAG: DUF2190 family protein [Thiohalorhabdus sp.]